MNILILTHEFPPIGGGSGRSAFFLSRELLKRGHHVSILTCKYKKFEIISHEGLEIYTVQGSRKNKMKNNLFRTFLSFILFGYVKAKKIIKTNNIDIVHGFMTIPAGFLGYRLKKKTGKFLVNTLAGSDVPYHSDSKLMLALKPVIKRIWLKSNAVVSVSKALRKTANRTYGEAETKFRVIYSGVDFNNKAVPRLKSKGLKKEKVKIISLCRLIPAKGIQDVLKALYLLQKENKLFDFEYKIIGDGPYIAKLKKLSNDYKLANHVFFTGYLNSERVNEEFEKSDFFILTSYSESLGIVFIEALAAGLPVIGSNIGGVPEIISSEAGLLVSPGNLDEISEAILKMVDSRSTYSKKNIIKSVQDFSWRNICDKYLEIYRKGIGAPTP